MVILMWVLFNLCIFKILLNIFILKRNKNYKDISFIARIHVVVEKGNKNKGIN